MKEPAFDIFTGTSEKNGVWLESVDGLSNARARMHDIAARIPGHYFVFSVGSRSVVAQIETETVKRSESAKGHAA
jgi:hypothetical protein